MEELNTFLDDEDVEVISINDLSLSNETSTTELEEEVEVETISPSVKANTELKTVDDQTEEVISEEKPIVVEPDFDDEDGEVVSIKNLEEEVANTIQYEYEEAAGLTDQEMIDAGLGEETYDPRIIAKFDSELLDTVEYYQEEGARRIEQLSTLEEKREAFMSLDKPRSAFSISAMPEFVTKIPEAKKMLEELDVDKAAEYEEYRKNIQSLLTGDNALRSKSVDALLNTDLSLKEINFLVSAAEFAPIYGAALGILDIPDNLAAASEMFADGLYAEAAMLVGVSAAEIGFSVVGGKVVFNKTVKPYMDTIKRRKETLSKIKDTTAKSVQAKKTAAKAVVKQNKALTEQMIKEFELSIDPTGNTKISKKARNGRLVLDTEAARRVGLGIAEDTYQLQDQRMIDFAEAVKSGNQDKILAVEKKYGVSANQVFGVGGESASDFVSPLLDPESFDAVIAVAADLKKKFPDAFNNDDTVIDNLFKLTVSDKIDGDDVADILAEYGLNFDQYVLTVVGSGSEAGKILNKLSQIKRAGGISVDSVETKQIEKTQGGILNAWRRIENIRRGSMTSMVKTAMRNFQSAAIRMPLETMENVADTVMLQMSRDFNNRDGRMMITRALSATRTGGQTLVSPSQWKGSLASLKRIYSSPKMSKELTEIILKNPQFGDRFEELTNTVNEYRKHTGAGSGGVADSVLGGAEKVVDVLSIPNRLQEYVIRRGVFTGEMERLIQREWGIDLIKEMENGNFLDIVGNSSKFRPKGAPAFESLVDDSIRRAMDVTYAKAPDVKVFRETANFLSRNGLTAFTTPFPRFMFNSMELLGQYSGGAFKPALDRIIKAKKGPLDAKDRQLISRNISGLMAITAAYQYRISGDAPADYKRVSLGEDGDMDTTSQFPMRQYLWIAEAMKRLDPDVQRKMPIVSGPLTALGVVDEGDGTFNDWFDFKEFQETFLGTAARTGTGNIFVQEIAEVLAGGAGDPTTGERFNKAAGRLVGDYIRTHLIPITQIVEIQRMSGLRPEEYKDYSSDDPFTFKGQVKRSLDQSGVTSLVNPTREFDLPSREFVFAEERKRQGLGLGLGLGITVLQKENEDAEYLISKGITEFEVGSKYKGSVRREENKLIREFLPMAVDLARETEQEERDNYSSQPAEYKKRYTIEQHVNLKVIDVLSNQFRNIRTMIGEGKYGSEDTPLFVKEAIKFGRMPKASRRYAMREFIRSNGTEPDMSNVDDIIDLIFFAKENRK